MRAGTVLRTPQSPERIHFEIACRAAAATADKLARSVDQLLATRRVSAGPAQPKGGPKASELEFARSGNESSRTAALPSIRPPTARSSNDDECSRCTYNSTA